MPPEQEDDAASKRSKRKRLMETASKVVDILVSASDCPDDVHYMIRMVAETLNHENPHVCPDASPDNDEGD